MKFEDFQLYQWYKYKDRNLDSRYYIAFIFIIAILPDALIYIMYSEKTFNISSTTRKRFGIPCLFPIRAGFDANLILQHLNICLAFLFVVLATTNCRRL